MHACDAIAKMAGRRCGAVGQHSCSTATAVCNAATFAAGSALQTRARPRATRRSMPFELLADVAARARACSKRRRGGELCVPCYDPRDGSDTLACRSGSDQPRTPPETFPGCCGAGAETHGRCLPRTVLEATSPLDAARLGPDSCEAPDALCVPEAWLAEEPAPLAMCRSIGDLEGRCTPACLPEVAALAERLTSRGCQAHELCAPCHDPRTAEPTGVCSLNGDRPREAPQGFARCCGTGSRAMGTCGPAAILRERKPSCCRSTPAHLGSPASTPDRTAASGALQWGLGPGVPRGMLPRLGAACYQGGCASVNARAC